MDTPRQKISSAAQGATEREIANATADSDTGHLHPRDAASNDLFYNPVLERIGW